MKFRLSISYLLLTLPIISMAHPGHTTGHIESVTHSHNHDLILTGLVVIGLAGIIVIYDKLRSL